MLNQPFGGTLVKKLQSAEQDDIALIKQLLLKNNKSQHIGGWELANELILPCLNIDRNEDIAESSKIYPSFKTEKGASVNIFAIIYVKEKMIIGLASVEGQEVEEKVPTVILAKSGWYTRQQAAILADRACLRTGPFKDLYDNLKQGNEIPEEQSYQTGEVTLGGSRDAKSVTAHMFVFKTTA